MCKRVDKHDRQECPYAHPGELARRRHPCLYQALPCPEARAVSSTQQFRLRSCVQLAQLCRPDTAVLVALTHRRVQLCPSRAVFAERAGLLSDSIIHSGALLTCHATCCAACVTAAEKDLPSLGELQLQPQVCVEESTRS
jgi:hypothetical protein